MSLGHPIRIFLIFVHCIIRSISFGFHELCLYILILSHNDKQILFDLFTINCECNKNNGCVIMVVCLRGSERHSAFIPYLIDFSSKFLLFGILFALNFQLYYFRYSILSIANFSPSLLLIYVSIKKILAMKTYRDCLIVY